MREEMRKKSVAIKIDLFNVFKSLLTFYLL